MQYQVSEFESIIDKFTRQRKSLIPILQDIQAQYNYLPGMALTTISKAFGKNASGLTSFLVIDGEGTRKVQHYIISRK